MRNMPSIDVLLDNMRPALRRRIMCEAFFVPEFMPGMRFYQSGTQLYVEGRTGTHRRPNAYKTRITIPPQYPNRAPDLYVLSPHTLYMRDGQRTVNSLGFNHAFHTMDNGSDGCVQICHTHTWDASMTCVTVLGKLAVWLEAYETHLRTGETIDAFIEKMKERNHDAPDANRQRDTRPLRSVANGNAARRPVSQ